MTRDLDRIRFFSRHFNDLQGLRHWVPLGLITLSAGSWLYLAHRPLAVLAAILFLAALVLMAGGRWYYRLTLGHNERQPLQPAAAPCSLSIFSPTGPTPRLEGFSQVSPAVRCFLITLGLALTLFFILQAISPTILIVESQSLVQPPGLTLDAVFIAEPHWQRTSIGWLTVQAVTAQTLYVLYGSFFLGLWIWRGRRSSQRHDLEIGVLLLGLATFGTLLGFFAWEDREWAVRIINLVLPAVVRPWLALILCGSSMVLAGLLDHRQLVRALRRPVA